MKVFAVLSDSRVYNRRVSGGLSAKSKTQLRVVVDAAAVLAGRFFAASTLSRRAFASATLSPLTLARLTALSFPGAVARTGSESARTESERAESALTPTRTALSGAAAGVTGVPDVVARRAPRHPAKIASTETVPSRAKARMRERRGVTRYLVGILTGARPLQLRMQRNFVSCGSDSKPRPVKVRDGSFRMNVLSVKIWLRT